MVSFAFIFFFLLQDSVRERAEIPFSYKPFRNLTLPPPLCSIDQKTHTHTQLFVRLWARARGVREPISTSPLFYFLISLFSSFYYFLIYTGPRFFLVDEPGSTSSFWGLIWPGGAGFRIRGVTEGSVGFPGSHEWSTRNYKSYFTFFQKKPQAGDRQGPRRMVSLSQICCWILAYPLPGRSLTFEGLWRSRTFQIPSKLRARALPMQNERPPGRRHIGRGNRSRSCSDGSPVNACVTANLLSEKSLVGFPRCCRTARKGVQQAKFRNKVKFHSPV